MHLLPEKYDQLELSATDKLFIKTLERAFKADDNSYLVLKVNPRKRGIEGDNATPELFHLLVFSDGILLFKMFDTEDTNIATLTMNALKGGALNTLISDIEARLKHSRYLTDAKDNLKFAFGIKLLFPRIRRFEVMGKVDNEFLSSHCLLEEDLSQIKTQGARAVSVLLKKQETVAEDDVNQIFLRICPETTIPRKYFVDEYQRVAGVDGNLTSDDRSVRAYRLDNSQINYVNRIGRGNQLILACAGSGKSVLLISKCFKLASLNPAENFLITCYNKNLRDYYTWTVSQAGFSSSGQVRVSTFLQLCRELLLSNGIPLPSQQASSDDFFKLLFAKADEALRTGRIKERFYGIFVDEIQIFQPEWYRFCFNLLKSKNESDHYFVIAGDKSQDIKSNIKQGKAPWQGHGDKYPKYTNRTFAIETNYRNSKPINDAIDGFVEVARKKGVEIGADLATDPELFLRGIAYRDGDSPVIVENRDIRNIGEIAKIIAEIKHLIETKEYSETDIAVIFYQKYSQGDVLINTLKSEIYREGWNDPAVLFGDMDRGTYGSRRGITIATIEGALGLDYRAVIIAGLHPLGRRDAAKIDSHFSANTSQEELEKRRKAFIQNVNYIYTGCTRAKDSLSIILSAEEGQCIYADLLRSSIGGRR